jgi:AraC-like DNA-binding protein
VEDFGGLELLKSKSSKRTHPRHLHDTYNIDTVLTGEHDLEHESNSHPAGPGCLFLFNPQEVHTSYLKDSPYVAHRTIYPTYHLMKEIARELKVKNGKIPFFSSPVVYDPELAALFNTAHGLYEQGADPLRAQSIMMNAFALVISRYSDEARELPAIGIEETAICRAKEFIQESYLKQITLNEIAAASGLSAFHFSRCFKQATGMPPFSFVINLRIEKAKDLLRNGMKIVEVAAATCFYDQSHFTNYFKGIVGVSPRQYQTALATKKNNRSRSN